MDNNENPDNIIILNDEDGNEIEFEFLDLIEYLDKEYVVLLPTDEDADEVVILEVEDTGDDEENYAGVDDPILLNTIYSIFRRRNEDNFNFED